MLRINADAQQLRLAEGPGVLLQSLHHLRKVIAQARAVIGKWAPRIDERQQQWFTAKLLKVDALAALVDEHEIGHFVTRLRNAQRRGTIARRVAAPGESDLLQLRMIGQDQRSMDLVARRNGLEYPSVFVAYRERHRHAFHQPGNVVMGNRELASSGIHCHHAALKFVSLARGFAGAGGERQEQEKREK